MHVHCPPLKKIFGEFIFPTSSSIEMYVRRQKKIILPCHNDAISAESIKKVTVASQHRVCAKRRRRRPNSCQKPHGNKIRKKVLFEKLCAFPYTRFPPSIYLFFLPFPFLSFSARLRSTQKSLPSDLREIPLILLGFFCCEIWAFLPMEFLRGSGGGYYFFFSQWQTDAWATPGGDREKERIPHWNPQPFCPFLRPPRQNWTNSL